MLHACTSIKRAWLKCQPLRYSFEGRPTRPSSDLADWPTGGGPKGYLAGVVAVVVAAGFFFGVGLSCACLKPAFCASAVVMNLPFEVLP